CDSTLAGTRVVCSFHELYIFKQCAGNSFQTLGNFHKFYHSYVYCKGLPIEKLQQSQLDLML
ncbi:MAG: hypothetical protein JWQ09_4091, partial [Segetibacter sp.]|nr:hypothetical protein [Segetibacter sp.]